MNDAQSLSLVSEKLPVVIHDPHNGLVSQYLSEPKCNSHIPHFRQIDEGICMCQCSSLSLSNYALARSAACVRLHHQPCLLCPPLLKVAETILRDGYCTLHQAFELASPNTSYDTHCAKRKLLQLPLVAIRIGKPASGTAFTLFLEYCHGVDYKKMSLFLNAMNAQSKEKCGGLEKSMVKKRLGLAQSDRERECIRYTIFKASGVTPTQARLKYGFEHMVERAKKVEDCIGEIQSIREAIDNLATIEDTALLATMGIPAAVDSDEESETSDLELNSSPVSEIGTICQGTFSQFISNSHCNWFDVVDKAEYFGLTDK